MLIYKWGQYKSQQRCLWVAFTTLGWVGFQWGQMNASTLACCQYFVMAQCAAGTSLINLHLDQKHRSIHGFPLCIGDTVSLSWCVALWNPTLHKCLSQRLKSQLYYQLCVVAGHKFRNRCSMLKRMAFRSKCLCPQPKTPTYRLKVRTLTLKI